MRGIRFLVMMVGGVIVSHAGLGQVGSGSGAVGGGHSAGKPYTAHFTITKVQTLANGTTITTESKEVQARDSEGRAYSYFMNPLLERKTEQITVHVNDPVARTHTQWTSLGKVATVTAQSPSPGSGEHVCWSNSPNPSDTSASRAEITALNETGRVAAKEAAAQTVREELGTQTIQGLTVTGVRTTRTIPAGYEGNDRAIVVVDETWKSKDPLLLVRTVMDDPRRVKETRELVEFEMTEPDPALFQAPADYRVVKQERYQAPCPQ